MRKLILLLISLLVIISVSGYDDFNPERNTEYENKPLGCVSDCEEWYYCVDNNVYKATDEGIEVMVEPCIDVCTPRRIQLQSGFKDITFCGSSEPVGFECDKDNLWDYYCDNDKVYKVYCFEDELIKDNCENCYIDATGTAHCGAVNGGTWCLYPDDDGLNYNCDFYEEDQSCPDNTFREFKWTRNIGSDYWELYKDCIRVASNYREAEKHWCLTLDGNSCEYRPCSAFERKFDDKNSCIANTGLGVGGTGLNINIFIIAAIVVLLLIFAAIIIKK